jgi:hypothetical protein
MNWYRILEITIDILTVGLSLIGKWANRKK